MLADSEDDVPLASRLVPQRAAAKRAASAPPAPPPPPKRAAKATKLAKPAKKLTPIAADEEGDEEDEDEDGDDGEGAPSGSKPSARPKAKDNGEDVWQTLEHHGVLFPPAYVPHGVPLLCDGAVVQLTPVEEEVASFFAAMLHTDYAAKPVFRQNFWMSFQGVLGAATRARLRDLDKCDFSRIADHLKQEADKKKELSAAEKKQAKADRDAAELKYTTALWNGKPEKVGNFRVEPPGLFRGRGEHPKMGLLKRRIQAEDVIINIGAEARVPAPPAGHEWKEVIHNRKVGWLAGWKDSINTKDWKYVQLGATSSLKADSDLRKFERARELKAHIGAIRADYTRNMASRSTLEAQLAVTTYLVDKLALRAGGEKDDDLADTVGHVQRVPPSTLKFDFLGKDSIRYLQEHVVPPQVYKAIGQFGQGKAASDNLFDEIDPTKVNKHLQKLMSGLTIKVFRTYNASVTLADLLAKTDEGADVVTKKALFDNANKEVAVLCNHQKSVGKAFDVGMGKMQAKKADLEQKIADAKKGDDKGLAKLEEKLTALTRQIESRESLKTVALGTSKINYIDPRITVAWCKKHSVPVERMFTKVLLQKFGWAMDVPPDWTF